MSPSRTCCICGKITPPDRPAPTASVRCNVREFADEAFEVWRCPACRSIHAHRPVDLEHYYSAYPFYRQRMDWALWCGYHTLLRRLRRAGIRPGQRLLDYGCGSGMLVAFLNRQGYRAVGYDPYSDRFADPAVLESCYDAVLAQDVIEHDEQPTAILDRLGERTRPGGRIVIGTPNAEGIDLTDPQRHLHSLHQPYHRHIFSLQALRGAGERRNWRLMRVYSTPYTNMPLLSLPFLHHYMAQADNTLDALFTRGPAWRIWLNPRTWWLLGAGYFLCDRADMMAIFRKER